MTFAEKLQRLRKKHSLSQDQLAEKLNVSRQAISRWETGATPDLDNVVKISRYFGCTVDYLLKEEIETSEISSNQTPIPKKVPFQTIYFALGTTALFTVLTLHFISRFFPVDITIRDMASGNYYVGFGKFVMYYGMQAFIFICLFLWMAGITACVAYCFFSHGRKWNLHRTLSLGNWILSLLGTLAYYNSILYPWRCLGGSQAFLCLLLVTCAVLQFVLQRK